MEVKENNGSGEEEKIIFSDRCRCANDSGQLSFSRVMEKVNRLYDANDYSEAERIMLYWLSESERTGDQRHAFSICNELMGIYRKNGNRDAALFYLSKTLALADDLCIRKRHEGAVALLNAATVYEAFDLPEKAIILFDEARSIFEQEETDGLLLAGLYNNMALTLTSLCRYPDAEKNFHSALRLLQDRRDGLLETAMTYLNLADLYDKRKKDSDAAAIESALDFAEKALRSTDVRKDGYYAFVCEKCAPVFLYYGRFGIAGELGEEVRSYRERN